MFFLKKCFQFCLVSLFFILMVHFGANESLAQKKMFTWGSASASSSAYIYFVAAAKVLNEKIPEVNFTVRATGSSVMNTNLFIKGEIDIGATDTGIAWEVAQGKGIFQGKQFQDLRLLYCQNDKVPLQLVVSEKSGVKDIYGLDGKIFCPGGLGTGAEKASTDIFRILGVKPQIRHLGFADMIEAIKNERIVGFSKFGAGYRDPSVVDVATVMKIRLISLSDKDVEKILRNTAGLRKGVVPSGMYEGVGEYTTVLNEYSDWVTKGFPAEIAYKMVKTLYENSAEIQKVYPSFIGDRMAEFTLGVKTDYVYLHPGAIKFYRELGHVVPKHLIPPEMGGK